jgi:hypothetical protein
VKIQRSEKNLKEPIRVGFDMDGVILYNPFRIMRPIVSFVKRYLLKRKTTKFYLPKSRFEMFIWLLLHKSSMFPAPGFTDLKQLIRQKKIKAYIVTSRYSTLKSDVEYWFKKLNGDSIFEGCYYNEGDIQPHLHKETMIKKLNLDYFVEDNWNIVQHVNDNLHKNNLKTKVLWISNIIDYRIPYEHKFSSLKKVVEFLKHEFEK